MKRIFYTIMVVYLVYVMIGFAYVYRDEWYPHLLVRVSKTCQYLALCFGRAGLRAEQRYYAVRSA